MKFDDLHPWFRWRLRKQRHNFGQHQLRELEKVWGPIAKRELPWPLYIAFLAGVAFIVVVTVLDLWNYFALLLGTVWGVAEIIFWKRSQSRDGS